MSTNTRMVKNILISVLVLLLLGAGYYLALHWEPKETHSPPAEHTYVIAETMENVDAIIIQNPATRYTLSYRGEKFEIPEIKGKKINESSVKETFEKLITVSAVREITSGAANLQEYGLSNPSLRFTVQARNGSKTTVLLGDKALEGQEIYCMTEGGDVVYTISSEVEGCLKKVPDDYREKTVVALKDIMEIQSLAVYHQGKQVLRLRPTTQEEKNHIMAGSWILEYPWKEMATPEKTATLLQCVSNIQAVGFVQNIESKELPYEIVISAKEEYRYQIGKGSNGILLRDFRDGECYIVEESLWNIIETLNPNDYIAKSIFLPNIKEISKVTITQGEKQYKMEITRQDKENYFINGEEVDEGYFKTKYQTILSPIFLERGEFAPKGTPYMNLCYEYQDGSEYEVTFYPAGEREYIALRSDGATMKLLRSELKKIEELLN